MTAFMRASLTHSRITEACVRTIEVIRRENGRVFPSDDLALRMLSIQGDGTTFVNSNGILTHINQELS